MRRPLFMTAALVLALSLISGAASAQEACSYEPCASRCPQILGPPNKSGLRGLTVDPACRDKCFQQSAACKAGFEAKLRAKDQQNLDKRRRGAEEEDARKKKVAAENRRILEEEGARARKGAAERAKLNKAADDDLRRRQLRDADLKLQHSKEKVLGQCRLQCAMLVDACLTHNFASDNVQLCQRQGNECRSNCKNPAFLPKKSFTFIPRPVKSRWGHHARTSDKRLFYWDSTYGKWTINPQ